MPLGGPLVANELEVICTDEKCYYLVDYLNRLYLFRIQYSIYRDELSK